MQLLQFQSVVKTHIKHIVTGVLLVCVCVLSIWMRIQGADTLPAGQFTGNDAYLFYKQAGIIAEHGVLPERDMHRWLPYGRDNGQILTLYPYTIAYLYKSLNWIFPDLTLYHIQLYLPVICFTLGLGVLFLFLAWRYGLLFAFIASVLLATVPGSVERSAIGFGDRDALCWMFGIFVVTSYLWKEQLPTGRRRIVATVLCGISVFLGGLSWGGFGIFLLIPMVLEFWKFCTTDTEQHLKEYILWIGLFVPWLCVLSPIYRQGSGFMTHVAALMLFPPLVIFAIRGIRFVLLKYQKDFQKHARKIAWCLAMFAMGAGAWYCYVQYGAFETTAFAFKESRFMKTMAELTDPDFIYWTDRYGAVFVLGSVGLILASSHFKTVQGTFLGVSLFLFTGTTFFRRLVDTWVGTQLCDILFFVSVVFTAIALAIAAVTETSDNVCVANTPRTVPLNNTHHKLILIAIFAWFILWVSLARSGTRYDFFIGVPLAFGTASLVWLSPVFFNRVLIETTPTLSNLKEKRITVGIAIVILLAILFILPLGGHVTRLQRVDFKIRPAVPGEGHMAQAITWIKDKLPQKSVVTANWNYGMPLNVLGGVRTITDSDTFLPHWIHLYYRHVFCAQSEQEALSFLKTHHATHLLLTEWGVTSRAHVYSALGSDESNDRQFGFYPLQRAKTPIGSQYRIIPAHPNTPIAFVDFDKTATETLTLNTKFKNGHTQQLQIQNPTTLKMVSLENGGLALYFDKHARLEHAYYIPPLGWNSFAVKMFLRNEHSEAFVQVYPTDIGKVFETEMPMKIQIWKINYPKNIQTDNKYLQTVP